jgi:FMN-dependent NADH-azoreductase
MRKLLYIKASPRGDQSFSLAAADAFAAAYRQAHPTDEILTIDLFGRHLPPFDGAVLQAKYAIMAGGRPTDAQKGAWKAVEDMIAEFKAADKYLLALPMWNFGIPYRLKHYIDVITQPGYTFSFSPDSGYQGLVTGKPIQVVYARGGAYPAGSPAEAYDLQSRYVELWLGFIGFTDVRRLVVEPTLGHADGGTAVRQQALSQAQALAPTF